MLGIEFAEFFGEAADVVGVLVGVGELESDGEDTFAF